MGVRRPFKSKYGTYYIEIDRKRFSLKTRNKDEADTMYKQIKKEYLAGKIVRLSGECAKTLAEYRDEYQDWARASLNKNTVRADMLALNKLVQAAGSSIRLDALTPRHADMVIKTMRENQRKPASINNFVRHARTAMNKAVEWQYLQQNPFSGCRQVPEGRRPLLYMQPEDIKIFLGKLSKQDPDKRRLALAYLLTGRRRNELLQLTWDRIDLEAGRYMVTGKGDHVRWFPMHPMFKQLLENWPGDRTGYLFKRWRDPSAVTHTIKAVLRETGYGHLSLHKLRHSFASMLLNAGKDLKVVQELLGHSDYRATLIYAHLTDDKAAKDLSDIKWGPMEI